MRLTLTYCPIISSLIPFLHFFFTQLHSDKKQIRLVPTFNNSFVEVVTERNSNLLSVLRLTPFIRREQSLRFLLRHGRWERDFWRGGAGGEARPN